MLLDSSAQISFMKLSFDWDDYGLWCWWLPCCLLRPKTKEIQENVSSPKLENLRRIVYTFRCLYFSNVDGIRVVRSVTCQVPMIPIDHNITMRRKFSSLVFFSSRLSSCWIWNSKLKQFKITQCILCISIGYTLTNSDTFSRPI